MPPPRGSTLRVSRHANAWFNLGAQVTGIEVVENELQVSIPKGDFVLDFLLFGTGIRIDLASRPEFAPFARHVRLWKDRYGPPADDDDVELGDSPDLGPVFEFQENTPGACPGLERIHCFCAPATLSHGALSGDIPAVSEGTKRLAQRLASTFYREDVEWHYANMVAFAEPEVEGNEWMLAPPPPALAEREAK